MAYGLVYHYFKSKDQVLDTLFLERWEVLLEAIRHTDATDLPAEEKLHAIAGFIIDSYRHDPDLMKVIIVEVTRAANSFGAVHIRKIDEAYVLIRGVVEKAQQSGEFRSEIPAEFAVDVVLRRHRAGAHRLDLRAARRGRGRLRQREGPHRPDHLRWTGRIDSAAMDHNDLVKRLAWSGLLAGTGALASIVTARVAAVIFRRIFGEDPPE